MSGEKLDIPVKATYGQLNTRKFLLAELQEYIHEIIPNLTGKRKLIGIDIEKYLANFNRSADSKIAVEKNITTLQYLRCLIEELKEDEADVQN